MTARSWVTDPGTRLERLCGKTIQSIAIEEHVAGSQRALISVWLEWADGGTQVRPAPHGYGLTLNDEKAVPVDMGRYGHTEVVDSVRDGLRPGRVDAVSIVHVSVSDEPVGFCLEIEGGPPVFLYCYGDELLIEDQIADELGPPVYTKVCRA